MKFKTYKTCMRNISMAILSHYSGILKNIVWLEMEYAIPVLLCVCVCVQSEEPGAQLKKDNNLKQVPFWVVYVTERAGKVFSTDRSTTTGASYNSVGAEHVGDPYWL